MCSNRAPAFAQHGDQPTLSQPSLVWDLETWGDSAPRLSYFDTLEMEGVRILPCLVEAACQVGSNPPHEARVSLAIYLAARLRNFLPVERATQEMREAHAETISRYIATLQWADYDENVTRYHVRSIVDKGYQQHCASLEDSGLCLGRCQLWDGTGNL